MKIPNLWWLLAGLAILIVIAVNAQPQQAKTYSVSGTISDHQAVLAVIEASNAPHSQVEAVKKWYVDQIQAQITAEGKALAKADSIRKAGIKADSLKKIKK